MSSTEAAPGAVAARHLDDPGLYVNRELSWLEFEARVLELGEDESVPLLERVKFASIFSTNLDEFFMIRVAGLHDQEAVGIDDAGPDGLGAREVLARIRARVDELGARQSRLWAERLCPLLAEHGIAVVRCADAPPDARGRAHERFHRQIFPVLTPLAVGQGRPFPYISNLSLSLAVSLRDPVAEETVFARIKVPAEILGRFVDVGEEEGETMLMPLEELIAANLDDLFPGMEILECAAFRVTRDADFEISDEADDLLRAVESELRRRRLGEVVRVEVERGMSDALRAQLFDALDVEPRDVYEVDGMLDLGDLMELAAVRGRAALRDPPWTAQRRPPFADDGHDPPDLFRAIRRGDLFVHHPYDSFTASVVRFVDQAVADPDVLAIKQTVYRTSDDSPLVPALIKARERDKQAACLVELKARFDERANIVWARRLEEAGVHVTYGLPGLKTHTKAILVVRREGDGVRHYVHVGTGNYHPKTARLYTDFGLFTCDDDIGADVTDMFNALTGYARPQEMRKVLLAPAALRDGVLARIEETIAAHSDERPARIVMKMNALVDGPCIRALYRASQAGVRVDLNLRGICCLRPGVDGVSDNIRVVSVVGRFLEHSRAFAFCRGGEWEVLIGSADLMPRNLDSRVELVVPLEDQRVRQEVLDVLERCLADEANAWDLGADGTWARREAGDHPRSVHAELMERYAARAAEGS
jgi:polyphosphate kinase